MDWENNPAAPMPYEMKGVIEALVQRMQESFEDGFTRGFLADRLSVESVKENFAASETKRIIDWLKDGHR
jgi:hypothetical protein